MQYRLSSSSRRCIDWLRKLREELTLVKHPSTMQTKANSPPRDEPPPAAVITYPNFWPEIADAGGRSGKEHPNKLSYISMGKGQHCLLPISLFSLRRNRRHCPCPLALGQLQPCEWISVPKKPTRRRSPTLKSPCNDCQDSGLRLRRQSSVMAFAWGLLR